MSFIFDLILAFSFLAKVINCATVDVRTDGPGIIDLPLTFHAKVEGEVSTNQFFYTFQDMGIWPPHRQELLSGPEVNYTLTYSKVSVGNYTMNVQVFAYIWGFKGWLIAENDFRFSLLNSLNIAINISQSGLTDQAITNSIVATNRTALLTAVINDGSRSLETSNTYTWTLDGHTFGPESSPEVNYTFHSNKSYSIEVLVLSNITVGTQIIHKLGKKSRQIKAKNEILYTNITGNTWLKDGALLRLSVNCTGGDPPFWYCYDFFRTKRDNYSCKHEMFETDVCFFPITHYFPKNGTHYLEIVISNDVNFKHKTILIKVYEIVRQTQLTFVIIPIMSSILAIIIIVVGIAYHLQQRHRYNITLEVADFDFQYSENLMEKTFFERLRESLGTAIRGTFLYPCTRATNYDDLMDDLLPEETIRNNNQRTAINTNSVSYGIDK